MRVPASSEAIGRARALLQSVTPAAGAAPLALCEDDLVRKSCELAELLLRAEEEGATRSESARARALGRLMDDPAGVAFALCLTDRAHRSREPARVVDQCRHLLRRLGIPRSQSLLDRASLLAVLRGGPFFPVPAARGILRRLRRETAHVVLSADDAAVAAHLSRRRASGARVNLNRLGEAVLGEREADRRVKQYLHLLARADTPAVSVKLSSITSQIDLLAWDESLALLRPRLRAIYEQARDHHCAGPDGRSAPKLVSLDMEAYRDLHLTFELFTSVLSEPALRGLPACMVLQAYLPESFALQQQLTQWARERVLAGGAAVRLRVVKGANLAAERVESALRGWPLPTYESKREVDANWKRMVDFGTRPEHARVVELGLGSHNVFDLAFGLVLRARRGVERHVGIELLEGMADPLQRVLHEVMGDTLLYCPVVDEGSMQTAIAYLMRRLDENTAPENFLRKSFAIHAGDESFRAEQARFAQACALRGDLTSAPRRAQDRGHAPAHLPLGAAFANEPDTDFSLAPNRRWIADALARAHGRDCFEVPMHVGGEAIFREPLARGFDPSRPAHTPYLAAQAEPSDIERALQAAERASRRFGTTDAAERAALLSRVARGLRERRGELIAAMVLDAGKRVLEADVEVSEAIDFAEHYLRSYLEHASLPSVRLAPKGVVLVTPPWNFPLAIPAGGVLAALAAGNAVILKPAPETAFVAERWIDVCYAAGVPPDVLQLVLCDDELGGALIRDSRVSTVVLTGATSTARLFQRMRPGLDLIAETGGKNAIVVSAVADRDQAIKDVLSSAFGHAGQKCSAASLLICEAEVYDDEGFQSALADATASLCVGSAWLPRSFVTPLIHPPSGPLARALAELQPGEEWLVPPARDADNPRLVGPCVRLGVQPGSFTHTTELFGPVLAVMRADDLDHAIALANATDYGLTSGLCSLDEREQERWQARIDAGNLYVNRGITGAVVRRQPFGGMKASSFGGGAKAGGPSYVLQLCDVRDDEPPAVVAVPTLPSAELLAQIKRHVVAEDHERLARAACTYAHAMASRFGLRHDQCQVLGEQNWLRYLPCTPLLVRAGADAILGDALLACIAAVTAGCATALSIDPAVAAGAGWLPKLPHLGVHVEDDTAFAERVAPPLTRIRLLGAASKRAQSRAAQAHVHLAREPVVAEGRIELLRYLREQTLTLSYHRNGNLEGRRLL